MRRNLTRSLVVVVVDSLLLLLWLRLVVVGFSDGPELLRKILPRRRKNDVVADEELEGCLSFVLCRTALSKLVTADLNVATD